MQGLFTELGLFTIQPLLQYMKLHGQVHKVTTSPPSTKLSCRRRRNAGRRAARFPAAVPSRRPRRSLTPMASCTFRGTSSACETSSPFNPSQPSVPLYTGVGSAWRPCRLLYVHGAHVRPGGPMLAVTGVLRTEGLRKPTQNGCWTADCPPSSPTPFVITLLSTPPTFELAV